MRPTSLNHQSPIYFTRTVLYNDTMKLEYLKNKLNLLVVTWLQLIDDVNNKSLKHLQRQRQRINE